MGLRHRPYIDFHSIYGNGEPSARLVESVVQEMQHGVSRQDLLALLDEERIERRTAGDLDAVDALVGVMERLDGWCAPEARL